MDGYDHTVDCDDKDASINPGACEYFDGIDSNCDGWDYIDKDNDAYFLDGCVNPDCDDTFSFINPGVTCDPCNGRDDDCDGIDCIDSDFDGYLSEAAATGCGASIPRDCDDTDPQIHPAMSDDICDGTDSNCDGQDCPTLSVQIDYTIMIKLIIAFCLLETLTSGSIRIIKVIRYAKKDI